MDLGFFILPATLALGCLLGFLGGLFGIGGGILAVPMLVLVFGMDQHLAQGTTLVMMVPNLLMAFWRYQQRYPVPLGRALQLALVASITTWLTAQVAHRLDAASLRSCFGLFLLWLVAQMGWKRFWPGHSVLRPWPERFLPLVGLVGGSASGLLGIGGGLVATPIFSHYFGLRQTMAQSFALALVTPSSLVALAVYSHAQQVDWRLGGALALGGLMSVSAGVAVAHHWSERRLQGAFGGLMLLTSLWMLLESWVP